MVNGGFFDRGAAAGPADRRGRKVIGLRRRRLGRAGAAARAGAIVHSREYPARPRRAAVTGAIQVGPRILVDGRVPGLKPQAARRTAVAVDHGGRS